MIRRDAQTSGLPQQYFLPKVCRAYFSVQRFLWSVLFFLRWFSLLVSSGLIFLRSSSPFISWVLAWTRPSR